MDDEAEEVAKKEAEEFKQTSKKLARGNNKELDDVFSKRLAETSPVGREKRITKRDFR